MAWERKEWKRKVQTCDRKKKRIIVQEIMVFNKNNK